MLKINEDNYFDIAEAIHCFCILNHSGQTSELYSILSQSEFRPGHNWSESIVEVENPYYFELTEENVSELFQELQEFLKQKED